MLGHRLQGPGGVPPLFVFQVGAHKGLQDRRQRGVHAYLVQHAQDGFLLQRFFIQFDSKSVGHLEVVPKGFDQAQGEFVQGLDGDGAVVVQGFAQGVVGPFGHLLGGPPVGFDEAFAHGGPFFPAVCGLGQVFQHGQDAFPHFSRGLVGEGHGQDAAGQNAVQGQVHVFVHQPEGFARSRTGLKHAKRLQALGEVRRSAGRGRLGWLGVGHSGARSG